MSFNKNNPNAVGKIMGYLKQLSTEMVSRNENNSFVYTFIKTMQELFFAFP